MAVRSTPQGLPLVASSTAALTQKRLVVLSPELGDRVPAAERAGAEMLVLDPSRDALSQIGTALARIGQVSSLRLISHGTSGGLLLAGQLIDGSALEARAAQVAAWAPYLSPGADLLLYGCQVAGTGSGQQLVDRLAQLTGADVAASANLTGAGGDLLLEYAHGPVDDLLLASQDDWEQSGLGLSLPVYTGSTSASFVQGVPGTFSSGFSGNPAPTYSIATKIFFDLDFNYLPDDWIVTGDAVISGGALLLTPAETNKAGALILPRLGTDSPAAFTARFDYTATGVTAGDGTSFNYGVLSTTTGSVTTMLSTGLAITFIESGTPRIDVSWNNVVVGTATNTYAGTAKTVEIKLEGTGLLTISYDGVQKILMNLGTKVSAADRSNWQFAFGATTTATDYQHAIDNLTIEGNGALPAGLTLDPTTGVISGTPTSTNSSGLQQINLVATNSAGSVGQIIQLALDNGLPVFTSSATAPITPGVAGTFKVAASGSGGGSTTYGVGKTLISTTLADATTLPTGAVIGGSAQFNAGALELTQNVVSQTGWLQFLGAGAQNPSSFSASFNYSLGGGTTPGGEGISFLYGAPGDMTKGLRVRINENNAGSNANLVISFYVNGTVTAQTLLTNPYLTSTDFRPVTLSMSEEGRLQVRVNGALAFDTNNYANWQAADKSLWAFAIRGETSSPYTNVHAIKDLVIATNGVLPPGLTLDTSTGVISGKVGIGTSVDSYVPVTATNAAGTTVQSLKIDVSPSATLPGQRPGTGASVGGAFTLGTTGQQFRNQRAFAALQPDGSVTVWGQNTYGGAQTDAPTGTGYTAITSNERAFAALKNDGSIFAWGLATNGGTGEPTGTGYVQISATHSAFAALKNDGSITVWGNTVQGGRPSVAPTGTGYVRIFANGGGFVAQKANGTTSSWGSTLSIGTSPPSPSTAFTRIVNTAYISLGTMYGAFAALDAAGSISIWGFSGAGGTSGFGTTKPSSNGWQDIVGTRAAFTAIDRYGSVASWGDTALGGTNRPSDSGYLQVYSNLGAFVAIRQDGSLTAWGNSGSGGTGFPTGTGYVQVYSTNNSFAALKVDGSISVWGSTNDGNTTMAPTGTGYTTILSTSNAFAALKSDGTISVWGSTSTGGTNGPTGTGWTEITANAFAFTAKKSDGALFSWGNSSYGGTGAPTNTGYVAVQSPTLMAPYFPLAAGQPVTQTLTQSISTQWFPGIQGMGLTPVVTSGALPPGLALDATTGWISGAPVQPGSFPFTITATGAAGSVSQVFTLVVDPPCGDGLPLPTGSGALWQQLALPCVPVGAGTVSSVFGNGSASDLTTDDYGVPNSAGSTGWVIERRDIGDTPANVRLTAADTLDSSIGYWIKSYQAPTGGNLSIATSAATATPAPVTQAEGCASAYGCKAIPVSTPGFVNRYNLVPNPFPYAVDWSKVRVRVTANSTTTVYSPCQAYGMTTEQSCTGPAVTPASPAVLSNQISIWNDTGTAYDTYSDQAPTQGNLKYFKSFWVKVLPGAFGQTIELLIPAEVSTLSQALPPGLPWYLAWLDWIAPPIAAMERPVSPVGAPQALSYHDWYVRLKVDNPATGWKDHSNILGILAGTQAGFDGRDLEEMAPFAKPYLTLVFPHPEWGDEAGDYSADFRPHPTRKPWRMDWIFEIRAEPTGGMVFLSWEGDPAILKRTLLIDLQTGKTINPSVANWMKKGYPITLNSSVQHYIWRYVSR